jgi:hypothetical protein
MKKKILLWLISNPKVRRTVMRGLKNPRIRKGVFKVATRAMRRRFS